MKSTNSRALLLLCFSLMIQLIYPWNSTLNASSNLSSSLPSIKVDFLAKGAEETKGYLPDYGDLYEERNGNRYGWSADQTVTTVTYSTYEWPPLENSYIRLQPDSVWEMDLPNGRYDLTVAVGDMEKESLNILQAEGVAVLDQVDVPAGASYLASTIINVTDGKLTLTVNDESATTALQYLEIAPALISIRNEREMIKPRIELPAEDNVITGNQIILSGNQRNEHHMIPAFSVPELQVEIGRYMKRELDVLQAKWQPYEEAEEVIRTGQLNLDNSVTFGSPTHPVYLVTNGINMNKDLTLKVYGTLSVTGDLNANQGGQIMVLPPEKDFEAGANLIVSGAMHLNSDSSVYVTDEMVVGNLTYNSGSLEINAQRLIVENSLHINTKVEMNIQDELLVGDLVSNNDVADLMITSGDFFVRDTVHINNRLNVITGGVWAIGGDITSNHQPEVTSGGNEGKTKLKYTPYGLKAEYFPQESLLGSRTVMLDSNIHLRGILPINLSSSKASVRWTGQIQSYTSEVYTFSTETNGGVRLWVNDELLINTWDQHGEDNQRGQIRLEADQMYNIQMEFTTDNNQPLAVLSWESGSIPQEVVPQSQLSPFAVPNLALKPSAADIDLSWTTSFNAEGYELEADGAVIVLGDQDSYSHFPLDSGTLHVYRVRANDGPLHGEWSNIREAWTLPGIPNNLRLNSTSNEIQLVWDAVTGANFYEVETSGDIVNNNNSTEYTERNLNPNMQRAFRVRAVNSSGSGGWSEVVAHATLPGTSSGLRATAKDTSIDVNWDAVSGAKWYDLEVDGTTNQVIGTSYTHEGLMPNTIHTYRVRSGSELGNSHWSELVTVVTLPSIPQNLKAEAERDQINLVWDPVSGATSYDIEVDGSVIDNGTSIFFAHGKLLSNTEHTYRVRARNGEVTGEWTDLITRVTLADFPVNIQGKATASTIELTWDPVIGAMAYDVEADGEIYNLGLELSFEHKDLLPYSEHQYRVRARSAGGEGPWSEMVIVMTLLGIPEHFAANPSMNFISLTWDPVSGATGYDVAADGEVIDAGDVPGYIHDGLEPSSTHVYRVRAKNGFIFGPWSEAVVQTTGLGIPVIQEAIPYSDRITIKWDGVEGATEYDVEANGEVIHSGSEVTFEHLNLPSGATYTYRVRARNDISISEWSDPVTVTTTAEVVRFISDHATKNSIDLKWSSAANADSYDLEVDGEVVSGIFETSYMHQNLEPNTIHVYRVRVHSTNQANEWSDFLEKRTITEMIADVGKDNIFNLVVVAPPKAVGSNSKVTVTYDPSEVEVLDLSTLTPIAELHSGPIENADMSIESFIPGEIVIRIQGSGSTFVNGIRFLAITNNPSSITYFVE
ncbi:fibronectin type III domain-containing protein [Paenibacillus senegalimassiliensis]|uniref:fibronectin type III domain-containing protein n=1 Tax=Paenibacillus senegalimassiliensis TaxID=1737426 RepID=UPI00073EEFEE|nr:PA14 domain-containing protein [Paenibacillus senegalimassiliensis]